ncbi:MAG: lysophospholipid acyltransferase family protein [Faecousia sp.]
MRDRKEIFFTSYSEDVVFSANQDYALPPDYRWVENHPAAVRRSRLLYRIALVFAGIYCPLVLHVKVVGKEKLPKRGSFYLYGNHTQPMGDAFTPAWICGRKWRIYVPISPANLGIPVLGRLLPYLGGLPVPEDGRGFKQFLQAMQQRTEEGNAMVIYPEAHVWPYYTGIRPFDGSAFAYPVWWSCPSYCMTTTYQKRRWRKKPRITVYLDGPYWPDSRVSRKKQKEQLRQQIYSTMLERSKESNYAYYQYTLQRRQGD